MQKQSGKIDLCNVTVWIELKNSLHGAGDCQSIVRTVAKLPNGENAVVDIGKLVNYVLNPNHEAKGRHKARLFQAMLDINAADAYVLRASLLEAARTEEATLSPYDNGFGQSYILRFVMVGPSGRSVWVTTRWIFDIGSDVPRFTSGWPETDEQK